MRILLILCLAFPFTSSAKTKSVDDYIEQYKYLSCSGIKNKRTDIDKKYIMASKQKKKRMKKQISALNKLKKANSCKNK